MFHVKQCHMSCIQGIWHFYVRLIIIYRVVEKVELFQQPDNEIAGVYLGYKELNKNSRKIMKNII